MIGTAYHRLAKSYWTGTRGAGLMPKSGATIGDGAPIVVARFLMGSRGINAETEAQTR
jgi:hypothetical protein